MLHTWRHTYAQHKIYNSSNTKATNKIQLQINSANQISVVRVGVSTFFISFETLFVSVWVTFLDYFYKCALLFTPIANRCVWGRCLSKLREPQASVKVTLTTL